MVQAALEHGFEHRRAGSTAVQLGWVADGRCDGVATLYCSSWDVLAGLLLVDTLSLDDMRARVASISREGSPWRANALELTALAAIREGKWNEADANARLVIADPATPPGLRAWSSIRRIISAIRSSATPISAIRW